MEGDLVDQTSRREVLEKKREKRPATTTKPSEAIYERGEYRNRGVEVEDVCESGILECCDRG
jgi:hypothetical protein